VILSFTEFIGHFHPVLVHLPIGILLVAVIFYFLSKKEKYKSLHAAVGISLILGMISAITSCISGYLLSTTDDYDEQMIFQHQWLGIATAFISILAYFFYKKEKSFLKWIMLLLALLIIITGHLGGSLTHGSNYLTKAFSFSADTNNNAAIKPVANVQEAVLYSDVIKPILQTKCYSCHGANKQKGKLRLDEQNFILKGGKDGPIIIAGNTDESELIKRILLPKEDEDHMPPKEKPQLSKNDMDLFHWWVSSGADFNKKIKELPQTDKIKSALLALQSAPVKEESKIADVPLKPVGKASDSAIQKLKTLGVMIIPVAQNSNYLSANFITAIFTDKDLQLLEQIKEQLIWLKLGNTKITDAGLIAVSKLKNLTRLYVENTAVTDNGLGSLKSLQQLQYLNLTATKVTANGIVQLKELKNLQQIYLYKTGVNGSDYFSLKKIFPQTVIDTGGYKLEMLVTDTTLVKPPQPKK
jgi:uncharacterized membrane protein/mono/diheme cytochrome c family protein